MACTFRGRVITREHQYTLGASLGVDAAGTITYYYYGKEAGYRNDFWAGSLAHSSGFSPTSQSLFGNPSGCSGMTPALVRTTTTTTC